MSASPTITPPSLSSALGFTNTDLIANRGGALSPSQRERLKRVWRRTLIIGIAAVIGVTFAASLFLFLGRRNDSGILTLVGLALTGVNAAIVGLGARTRIRLNGDLRGAVKAEDTPVNRTLRVVGRGAMYVIKTGGQELAVNKDVFNAFEDGVTYRLYRSAASRALLSAERLN